MTPPPWGLAGISLAAAMGITIVLAALNSIKFAQGTDVGDEVRARIALSVPCGDDDAIGPPPA